jgi:hypothetical protein
MAGHQMPTERHRRRLSRTLSQSRWKEYRELLVAARAAGYRIVSLEGWISEPPSTSPTLILRHDVDQHPRSALTMAGIEQELGIRSSWYFRWRTAHPRVISRFRRSGLELGLHYETLTRIALSRGLTPPISDHQIQAGRIELRQEIAAFVNLFGPIRSVVPHGDSRIPDVSNADLLRGEDCSSYGIEFDGNEAMRGRGIARWLTDRSTADGGWGDDVDPRELLSAHATPILCLTHPNNWVSGPSLWLDRALSKALPDPSPDSPRPPIRTGSDRPPLNERP